MEPKVLMFDSPLPVHHPHPALPFDHHGALRCLTPPPRSADGSPSCHMRNSMCDLAALAARRSRRRPRISTDQGSHQISVKPRRRGGSAGFDGFMSGATRSWHYSASRSRADRRPVDR
jgi:hypothetical protein